MRDAERKLSEGGHFLRMNFLLALCFVACVGFGDCFETFPQSFTRGRLLRVREQLVSLRPNLPSLIVGELLTHLFNKNQQSPPSSFVIFTTLSYSLTTFETRFGFLFPSKTT